MTKIVFCKSSLVLLSLSFLFIVFIGCGKDDNNFEENPKPIDVDIYVAGYQADQAHINRAMYWQNNQAIPLTGYNILTETNDIVVDNGNSYVVGYLNADNSAGVKPDKAIIWKNGVPNELLSPLGSATFANKVFVSNGNVYVAGHTLNRPTLYATLWINGNATHITDGTNNALLNSVYVSGNDVYVAGQESEIIEGTIDKRAKYWKNGNVVALNSGTKESAAEDIFVNGSDVYVVGTEDNDGTKAMLWKNGVSVNLAKTGERSYAKAVTVSNEDVYVVGHDYLDGKYTARLWKNGVLQSLELNDFSRSLARDVQVIDGNVFVCGYIIDPKHQRYQATVWKNGKSTVLTTGEYSSVARGISVVLK